MKSRLVAFLTVILAFFCLTNAYGYEFPEGSVQGLPQNLIVMDENGHSPDDGELYIYIENMIPYEVYKKNITIMNARDDAVYAVYMAAEPNYNKGDIDLLGETLCRLYLDGSLIYEGLVNGDGEPNMRETPLDLGGVYNSGESRRLYAEFVWQPDFNEESDTDNAYHGEVSFNWIFSASVTEPTTGSPSKTTSGGGGGGGGKIHKSEGNTNTASESETSLSVNPNPSSPDISEPEEPDEPDEPEGPEEPDEPLTEAFTEETTEGVIERLVGKIPIIPEDVKTGYKDELVLFVKGAVCAFGLAAVLLALIIHKSLKLKRHKSKGEEAKL